MKTRMAGTLVAFVVVMGVLAAGCGDDDDTASDDTASDEPPTVEQLADGLLAAEDLGEGWTSTTPPGFDGVITDEMRSEGGDLDLCEEAGEEAVAAMASIGSSMQVVASFDLTVERDDVDSVNITETAFADDRELVTDLARTLFDGYRTCLGVGPDPDEPVLEARELDLSDIGDDHFGFLLSLGDEQDRWDTRTVMVADGPVIVSIALNEILSDEPVVSDAELDDIVTTAVEKLR